MPEQKYKNVSDMVKQKYKNVGDIPMSNEHRARYIKFLGSGFKIPGLVDKNGEIKVGDKFAIDRKLRMEVISRLANDPECDFVKRTGGNYTLKVMKNSDAKQ